MNRADSEVDEIKGVPAQPLEAADGEEPDVGVLVIGAGFSGLLMGIKLREAGITDFVICEKGHSVGGTWRDNTYPGVGCDIPSLQYCYSFALNPEWSHRFSPGEEIRKYLEDIADRYQLRPHLRFDCPVVAAHWTGAGWSVTFASGMKQRAKVVVAATGVLHQPAYPEIPGLDQFAGPVVHTARWRAETPLDGMRVGIIGTGTSAAQVIPAIADRVAHLDVFQRTPNWVLPVANPMTSAWVKAFYRRMPRLLRWSFALHFQFYIRTWSEAMVGNCGLAMRVIEWLARKALRTVRDPQLRARLTPHYRPGCKRIVLSNRYYPALQLPHISLIDDSITSVTSAGVNTADGALHACDVLILATGFRSHDYVRPMRVVGENAIRLDEVWADRPVTWRSIAVPHMPNFFFVIGPYSPIANLSVVQVAEWQVGAIMRLVRRALQDQVAIAPTTEATSRYMTELLHAAKRTVWSSGCQSWFLGRDGLPELYSHSPFRHRAELAEPPSWSDYDVKPLASLWDAR